VVSGPYRITHAKIIDGDPLIEAVDVSTVTVPNTVGISLEANYAIQSSTGATGAKTATASNDADVGNAHILALKPKP
jgi:hypothetical protein